MEATEETLVVVAAGVVVAAAGVAVAVGVVVEIFVGFVAFITEAMGHGPPWELFTLWEYDAVDTFVISAVSTSFA